jgi:predicted metal-binding membrane protein
MSGPDQASLVLARQRAVVIAGLAGLIMLSWAYTLWVALEVYEGAHGAFGPHAGVWDVSQLIYIAMMWMVMMTAMMVPSVSPTIVMFSEVSQKHKSAELSAAPTWVFIAGYLAAWGLFSVAATGAQWGLIAASLLTPIMETKSAELGGAILISAGAFQFTSLKYACLQHCRSPFAFFMASWRPGCTGALSMGFRHGLYCVGCCWALMAVMFVGGVMNPLWLVALAVFVLIEKFAPSGCRIGQVTGALLVAAGVYMITLY